MNDLTTAINEVVMLPIIEYVKEHRGSQMELTRRLSKALGRPIHRQLVDLWLHDDPEKRVEPGGFGLAVVILHEAHKMMEKKTGKPNGTIDLAKIIRRAKRKHD